MDVYGNLACKRSLVQSEDQVRINKESEQVGGELEVRVLKLDAIFGHIQSLLKEQVGNKMPAFEVDRNKVPHWLQGDPARMRQAVLNHALSVPSGARCARASTK